MRNLTKADRIRGEKLKDMGCIVCLFFHDVYTPSGIHHIDGQTKVGCHKLTLPLCGRHHQIPSNTKAWISRHGDGRHAFEKKYCKESVLLKIVNRMIANE